MQRQRTKVDGTKKKREKSRTRMMNVTQRPKLLSGREQQYENSSHFFLLSTDLFWPWSPHTTFWKHFGWIRAEINARSHRDDYLDGIFSFTVKLSSFYILCDFCHLLSIWRRSPNLELFSLPKQNMTNSPWIIARHINSGNHAFASLSPVECSISNLRSRFHVYIVVGPKNFSYRIIVSRTHGSIPTWPKIHQSSAKVCISSSAPIVWKQSERKMIIFK